ncbi:MAG: hypothetical protein PHZ00_01175 [Candidatus Peribacteraceae bacterium]|nr:hypothetical protein [Candidatus Peribacteraceae bacterium]
MPPEQYSCCITPSNIFPGTEVSLEHLRDALSGLNRNETLIYCARWNLIFCDKNTDSSKIQEAAMNWFLTQAQKAEMIRQSGSLDRVVFLFRGGLVELMRWAALYCDPSASDPHFYGKARAERRNELGKAMMIANHLWLKSVGTDMFPDLEGDELRLATLVRMRLNKAGTTRGREPGFSLGIGYSLFCDKRFFPKFYSAAFDEFKALTGRSLKESFICASWLISNLLGKTLAQVTNQQNHNGIFSLEAAVNPIENKKYRPIVRYYFLQNVQTPEEMKASFWRQGEPSSLKNLKPVDEMVILNKPIMRVDDGRSVILDPVPYGENVVAGSLFTLVRNPKKTDDERNNIIAKFGLAFEQYAIRHFKAMYRSKRNQTDVLHPNPVGKEGRNKVQIADVCITGDREAVLVEAKVAFIKSSIVMDRDNDAYIKALKEKYVDGKGVAQLAKSITNLANGIRTADKIDFTAIDKIYPVLLVHDPLMDSFSHSWYLNLHFKECLSPDEARSDGSFRKGHFVVAPLTLIVLDDFKDFESSIRRGLSLRGFLSDYSINYPERIRSVHDYIALSKYRNYFYTSVEIARDTLKILGATHKAFYPWSLRRIKGQLKNYYALAKSFVRRLFREHLKNNTSGHH